MIIPDELINRLISGEIVPFVGSGVSMNAGLPGWIELIRPLAEAGGIPWPADERDINTEHLLTIAQYYENQFGRNQLIRFIIDKLDISAASPSTAHYLLTLLPVNAIFTTNYDNLLEQAFQNIGCPANAIVAESELAYWQQDRTQLIKMCGDIKRPDSIYFTKSDFNIYAEVNRRLVDVLRMMLETKTALFLGYSLKDPFLIQTWDSIRLNFGKHQRLAYALLFDAGPLEIKDLQIRNIHPILLDDAAKSKKEIFLDALIAIISLSSKAIIRERFERVLKYIQEVSIRKKLLENFS